MSSRLAFPLSQVRHSNVAVVRLTRKGSKLEVACYKNKVMSYRSGAESRLDEVVQIERVFTNVARGEFASLREIHNLLGDKTEVEAIEYIVRHGDLQIAAGERDATAEDQIKEICAVVALKTVHPETKRQYTTVILEEAANKIGFAVRVGQAPKKQALWLIRELVSKQIIPIMRAHMRLRLSPATDIAVERLKAESGAIIEQVSELVEGAAAATLLNIDASKTKKSTKKSASACGSAGGHDDGSLAAELESEFKTGDGSKATRNGDDSSDDDDSDNLDADDASTTPSAGRPLTKRELRKIKEKQRAAAKARALAHEKLDSESDEDDRRGRKKSKKDKEREKKEKEEREERAAAAAAAAKKSSSKSKSPAPEGAGPPTAASPEKTQKLSASALDTADKSAGDRSAPAAHDEDDAPIAATSTATATMPNSSVTFTVDPEAFRTLNEWCVTHNSALTVISYVVSDVSEGNALDFARASQSAAAGSAGAATTTTTTTAAAAAAPVATSSVPPVATQTTVPAGGVVPQAVDPTAFNPLNLTGGAAAPMTAAAAPMAAPGMPPGLAIPGMMPGVPGMPGAMPGAMPGMLPIPGMMPGMPGMPAMPGMPGTPGATAANMMPTVLSGPPGTTPASTSSAPMVAPAAPVRLSSGAPSTSASGPARADAGALHMHMPKPRSTLPAKFQNGGGGGASSEATPAADDEHKIMVKPTTGPTTDANAMGVPFRFDKASKSKSADSKSSETMDDDADGAQDKKKKKETTRGQKKAVGFATAGDAEDGESSAPAPTTSAMRSKRQPDVVGLPKEDKKDKDERVHPSAGGSKKPKSRTKGKKKGFVGAESDSDDGLPKVKSLADELGAMCAGDESSEEEATMRRGKKGKKGKK